jgi:hypothetical protein
VKCEYAQLDKKRKIKTTTGEVDLSGGKTSAAAASSKGNACSATKGGASTSKGGINLVSSAASKNSKLAAAAALSTTTTGGTRSESSGMVSARTRSSTTKKHVSHPVLTTLTTNDADSVPLDLSSSPFTPVSLLYQQEQSAPLLSNGSTNHGSRRGSPLTAGHPTDAFPSTRSGDSTRLSAFYTHGNKEVLVNAPPTLPHSTSPPSSSTSYGSTEYLSVATTTNTANSITTTPTNTMINVAPEASSSPLPIYSTTQLMERGEEDTCWSGLEEVEPPSTSFSEQSAFRQSNAAFPQSSFY